MEAILPACHATQELLPARLGELHSWEEKVGAEIGVTGAMAYRVATQGYQPLDPEIRGRLGLPQLNEALCVDVVEFILWKQ